MNDMSRIVAFVVELDKLKGVTRKTRPLGLDRQENSAEHSWQIALLAASLEPFAPAPVNIHRVIEMLLVHDIGEIDAGDTIVYQDEGAAERKLAEAKAVERIFGPLPAAQRDAFLGLWREFEEGKTPEARFAHAADRAMPVLLNLANKGQSWVENGITHERVVRRIGPPIKEGCPELWKYLELRLEKERSAGWFAVPGK